MHEILLPKMGQTVEEAEIVQWFKQEGDAVAEGDALFSIQTDKAEVECESTASGILRKIIVGPGEEVPVLTVVAFVGEADEAIPEVAGAAAAPQAAAEAAPVQEAPAPVVTAASAAPVSGEKSFVSPRARKAAQAKGIDPSTLQGSGVLGRVLESDVLAQTPKKASPTARRVAQRDGVDISQVDGTGIGGKVMKADVLGAGAGPATAPAAATPAGEGEALTPMRRIIAERMCASKFAAPHYYVTVEVDMSKAKSFRGGLGFKASYNDLVLYATMKALRDYPQVNVQWAGDAIVPMPDVNLGMAVALPTGLIVPVIKQAQNLSLEGLCGQSKALAQKAQTGKLLPDDYTGNTFTISNLGAYGVDHFTAIINQPDSAILAVGQMKDRPVVVEGGIFIRPIMKLTLSSDHRVVDGSLAAQFMGRLKEVLESASF